jgi:hypothetical protein
MCCGSPHWAVPTEVGTQVLRQVHNEAQRLDSGVRRQHFSPATPCNSGQCRQSPAGLGRARAGAHGGGAARGGHRGLPPRARLVPARVPVLAVGRGANARITPCFFAWLVGPMEVAEATLADGTAQRSAVKIERCRCAQLPHAQHWGAGSCIHHPQKPGGCRPCGSKAIVSVWLYRMVLMQRIAGVVVHRMNPCSGSTPKAERCMWASDAPQPQHQRGCS